VEYQTISDPAQLQILEGLMRMLLHGVLLAMAGASVLLLCLCLSELWLPRRRASEVEARDWKRSESPRLAARRGAPLDRLTPIRLWDKAPDLSGGPLSAETTPAHWLGQSERGHGWGGPAEVR
jgi:hypothetical protein